MSACGYTSAISRNMIAQIAFVLAIIGGTYALFETCDYYQQLQYNTPYYVYSPGYPNKYKAGDSCRWIAVSPPGTKIFLICETLAIPASRNCQYDRLTISLTGKSDFSDGVNYCGNGTFNIVSSDNKMSIALISASNSPGGGFLCNIGIEQSQDPAPQDCDCGWKNSVRIVGGQETGVNEYPMMASLIDGLAREHLCGATIIGRRFAVTAAHCLLNKRVGELGLLVGDHDMSTGADTDAAKLYLIDKLIYHESYNSATHVNDIALLRTEQDIQFNRYVGPACLPILQDRSTFSGQKVWALGWGSLDFGSKPSTKLHHVPLDVISQSQCRQMYGNRIIDDQLCTYTNGKDSCQSDSGGPLLWRDPNSGRWKLVGIISYGVHCASNYPGVNTRVTSYLNWIKQNTREEYCVK